MAKRGRRRMRGKALAALFVGGSVLQLGSCDPTVKNTLLTGLEATASTLTQTFITAFFVGLQDDANGGTTGLTTTP
ncbi:MAG: hypothetical protein GXP29_07770 [Planctomycetes bacterium]|nr:hypothetical protein [Planctomycetota bacterium]